jgi:hypothetical protein
MKLEDFKPGWSILAVSGGLIAVPAVWNQFGCGVRDWYSWHANPMPGVYVVRDANGQALAYLYSRDNEAEARQAKVLTKDEARRIAINVARLPELLGKAEPD